MEWELIEKVLNSEKESFKKAYKCINKNIYIRAETVRKHLGIIVSSLENIRDLINKHKSRFTEEHKRQSLDVYWTLRDQLVRILAKYSIDQKVPHSLEDTLQIDVNIVIISGDTERTSPIVEEEQDSDTDNTVELNMAQTAVEFLNTASRLIPDFDGKSENLRSFLDALTLVDSLKSSHEAIAVSLIKTKLKGNARNLIGTETTIEQIMAKLRAKVKGESVEVISAKIMNIRQNSKSANTYCSEIELLSKALESAYISDGLSCELATRYSTQVAVKAMTKNCTIDKVKLIMEAGQFHNMNDAIGKFVSSCTEATGQQNTVLHFGNRSRGSYRGGRSKFRGRGNYHNNRNGYNGNGNSNYRGSNNNRRGQNRNRQHNRDNGNNVWTTNNEGSENPNTPLRSEQ